MIPTLFKIPLPAGWGEIPIHSFGLCMVLCFLGAWRRLYISLKEAGEDPDLAERMITWAAVGGILGARISYLVSFPAEVLQDPIGTIFGSAGFVFYGGFIGGAFAVWILLRKLNKNFLLFADLTAPCLALGYAIGRVGCQLSGDGDYGQPTDLPWAMSYALGVVPTKPGVLVHPSPVYETVLALLIAWLLVSRFAAAKFPGKGQRFGIYLLLSGLARFAVEFVRIEPVVFSWLTQAQVIGLVLSLLGLGLIILRRNTQ